jgi:SNF2 family DNA or RNA helicase
MFELRFYQKEASEWLQKAPNRLLAHEVGCGKTPPSVRACVEMRVKNVLIHCPPIATGVWARHFHDWAPGVFDVRVFDQKAYSRPYEWAKGPGVRIIPYSRVSRAGLITNAIRGIDWDLAIFDETHALKNPDAIRTRQIYGERMDRIRSISGKAGAIWCLTGTPVLNHAADLWPTLHALAPETITVQNGKPLDYLQFMDRFCVVDLSGRIVGSKRTDELHQRLLPFMHRRTKSQVLKDLPSLTYAETFLPPDTPIAPGPKAQLQTLTGNLFTLGMSDDEFLGALRSNDVHLATVRRLIGEAKAVPTAELVDDMLSIDPERKVLVFFHHTTVGQTLFQKLRRHGAIHIDGKTLQRERQGMIDKFQTSPHVRVAVLQILTAGESVTLTAACDVVFAEASWTPKDNIQAAGRAHRFGQKLPVLAQFVTLPGTVDEIVQRVLARKAREISGIVDGRR